MLATLKDTGLGERRGLLANAALAMHRDPALEQFRLPEEGHLKSLIEEGAYELNIDLFQLSDKNRMRLANMFSGELKKITLDNKSRRAARSRLDQKGFLSLEDYKIRGSDHLKDQVRRFGIRIEDVRETLRSPTSYQHLVPEESELESWEQFSLFVRYFGDPRATDFYWILAIAKRENNVIRAVSAWRIFKSDLQEKLDLVLESPLDLLVAFTKVFGLPIRVGGGRPSTFILNRKIPLSSIDENINLVSGHGDKDAMFTTSFLFRKNTDPPSMDVAIAFCIDDTKYLEALRKHGVNADA